MISVPTRVKDALREGNLLKNYRFNVLLDDGTVDFTIDNDNLVSESVKFDERMATGSELKFGLCEGSSLEFQYFDFPNIRGRRIQAFIDVQYKDSDNELAWHEIPMGFFDIDQCSTQFSTGIIKAVGYNKLRSDYLDKNCNEAIVEAATIGDIGQDGKTSIGSFLENALSEFAIEPDFERHEILYRYEQSSGIGIGAGRDIWGTMQLFRKTGVDQYEPAKITIGGVEQDAYLRAIALFAEISGLRYNYDKYWRLTANCKKYMDFVKKWFMLGDASNLYTRKLVDGQYVYIDVWERMSSNNAFGEFAYQLGDSISPIYFGEHEDDSEVKNIYVYGGINGNGVTKGNFGLEPYFYCAGLHESIAEQEVRLASVMVDILSDYMNEFTTTNEHGQVISNDTMACDVREDTSMEDITFTVEQAKALPNVTLRELQSAVFESACQYGQLDRVTDLFMGVDLNRNRLYPADNLYPANDLYPLGNSSRANKSMYSKLWTDSQGEQTFRYLIITYKGLDENQQEVEKTLQRTVNADGTTDYNMSNNWLFKNLVWSDADVGDYADAMVEKMRDISWFPFEMWCAGLPYIETGDEIEISHGENTYTSYVLQRQLNGIQNLQDTYINGELDIF